jgi:hypothetical protein
VAENSVSHFLLPHSVGLTPPPSAGWPVGHNSVLSDVDEYVIAASVIGHEKYTEETPRPGSRANFTVNPRGILRSVSCKVSHSLSVSSPIAFW